MLSISAVYVRQFHVSDSNRMQALLPSLELHTATKSDRYPQKRGHPQIMDLAVIDIFKSSGFIWQKYKTLLLKSC